jgi:hypothetical protein
VKRTWRLGAYGAAVVACVAAACLNVSSWALKEGEPDDTPPAAPPAKIVKRGGVTAVTDADVVASMKKGIDFLLKHKKGDNWEEDTTWPGKNVGGVTAIALYALLHAGESLQDVPEYHAKLHYRSAEMQPMIAWLKKNKPEATYTCGLEASALTMIPQRKDEKREEGVGPTLDWCKWYLMGAMGSDGGYTYVENKSNFSGAWDAYFEAALRSKSDKAFQDAKKKLDAVARGEYTGFGGPELEMQRLAQELREKTRNARSSAEIARLEREMRELDEYMNHLPPPADPRKQLEDVKKKLDHPETTRLDPNNKKKKIHMTKEEIATEIEKLKAQGVKLEQQIAGTSFRPFGDLSNGQYGTLGAWALSDYGVEMPNKYWEVQDRFWRLMQNPDGGWPYKRGGKSDDSRPTMTMAGVASLFVCQEFTDTELRLLPKPDKNLDKGLAWLVQNFKPLNDLYYLYGVERVGLSSGMKFFGKQDWYREGAAVLCKAQSAQGSWAYHSSTSVGTAYALLFLSRGRNPVCFNKLQYAGSWNARPRDDAYLTRWMSKNLEKPINWQVVNFQVDPSEWMDAPVLMITGSQDPKFKPEEIEKLRQYVNAGGMIFSTADGGPGQGAAFTNAIRKYAEQIVNGRYEMRVLPKNHQLFSREMNVEIPNPPQVLGMSNGVRELWIHSSMDLGADWQMRRFANKTSFEMGKALYFYASGMGSLRSKLQPLTIAKAGPSAQSVSVARLDYAGNADPEPGAWPRLAKLTAANANTDLKLATVKFADLDPKKYPLASLTGTAKVTFTDDEVKALKAYLDGGGLLFADAAGGNTEFAASCEDLFKRVYPNEPLAPVPPDSPLYTGSMKDGVKIAEADFRKFGNLQLQRRVSKPALQQIVTTGRTRVLFSKWDVCTGFLGTNTWGIIGYAPSTAEALGRNIVLFSLNPAAPGDKAATANP